MRLWVRRLKHVVSISMERKLMREEHNIRQQGVMAPFGRMCYDVQEGVAI